MKRFFTVLTALALALSLVAFGGCGDRGPAVMEYEGVKLTEDIYRYWISCYKAQLAYEINGENEEQMAALIDENIKKSLVCVGLFNRYGLTLNRTAREQIDRGMKQLLADVGGGDMAAFNEAAAVYGIDYEGLKIAFSYDQMAAALREYLFGDRGYYAISEQNYEKYYEDTYAHVQMIYISLVDFTTDEDGLRLWDSESGSYVYTKKKGVALQAQLEKAAAVRALLSGDLTDAGFRAIESEYGEDPSADTYTDGYYFSKEVDYDGYIKEVTDRALTMEVGSFAEVESDIGIHFLYRTAPTQKGWDAAANEDFFEGFIERVRDYYFEWTVSQETVKVAVYSHVKDTVIFKDQPENWELYW